VVAGHVSFSRSLGCTAYNTTSCFHSSPCPLPLLSSQRLCYCRWRSVPGLSSAKPRNEDPPRQAHIYATCALVCTESWTYLTTVVLGLTAPELALVDMHAGRDFDRWPTSLLKLSLSVCGTVNTIYSQHQDMLHLPFLLLNLRGGVGGDPCHHVDVPQSSKKGAEMCGSKGLFRGGRLGIPR